MQKTSKIKKEDWGKPKLTILMRARSGESVLTQCKSSSSYGSVTGQVGCRGTGCASTCSSVGAS